MAFRGHKRNFLQGPRRIVISVHWLCRACSFMGHHCRSILAHDSAISTKLGSVLLEKDMERLVKFFSWSPVSDGHTPLFVAAEAHSVLA